MNSSPGWLRISISYRKMKYCLSYWQSLKGLLIIYFTYAPIGSFRLRSTSSQKIAAPVLKPPLDPWTVSDDIAGRPPSSSCLWISKGFLNLWTCITQLSAAPFCKGCWYTQTLSHEKSIDLFYTARTPSSIYGSVEAKPDITSRAETCLSLNFVYLSECTTNYIFMSVPPDTGYIRKHWFYYCHPAQTSRFAHESSTLSPWDCSFI